MKLTQLRQTRRVVRRRENKSCLAQRRQDAKEISNPNPDVPMKLPLIILGVLAAVVVHAQNALPGQTANAMPTNPNLPTVWLIGDSTVRNGTGYGGPTGQWGWGAPFELEFDLTKINVVNRALGGTSSRTFYNSNWPSVVANVKQGDFVIMQFGHNDNNGVFTGAGGYRASLNGIGDDTQEVDNARSGQKDTVHSFGWYMKQFVEETKAKGATPIVCSLIPRKIWADGKIVRKNQDYFPYGEWAGQVAAAEKVAFVDLNEITARKYDALGESKVAPLFVPMPTEHTHTDWYGAIINAESVISGLKALKENPLAVYFSTAAMALPAADANVAPLAGTSTEQSAAAAAAARAATPGTAPAASATTTPAVTANPAPAAADLPTIYIVSDSTANNNANGGMGWGRPFAEYFDPTKVQVVNSAIAARSSRSYIVEGHWDQVLGKIHAGDFVLLQFGHNDTGTPSENAKGDRPSLPGLGEDTVNMANAGTHQPETVHTYGWYMRKYITDAEAKGAHIVVVTVTVRDIWTNPNAVFGTALTETANIVTKKDNYNSAEDKVEHGLDDGHGHNYAAECQELAKVQHVPLVDLTNMNADKFEKMGREQAKLFFQTQKIDHTHTNPAGADFNAASIVAGLKALKNSPFSALLSDKGNAVPAAEAKYVADNLPAEPTTTATFPAH